MPLFFLLLLQAAAGAPPPPADTLDRLMEPGISRELARHRASQIRAVRYELNLDLRGRDTAQGDVIIRFERRRSGDLIVNFRGVGLGAVTANGAPVPEHGWNGAHLRIPDDLLRSGENELRLAFAAAIAPAGASIIRFRDATDEQEYLYTLLVPADANQLFPSFDQPDLKARLALTLMTPPGWTALSNGALQAVDSSGGHSVFRFRPTEPISTYLMAFAAGPWATITRNGDVQAGPTTLYVRASRVNEVEADTIVALNRRALSFLEEYFGIPYPFGKLDMLLAPAFPFGGMEHPGAIFYNEDRLIFRERPTVNQLLARNALIYHEVAHQWFGDLVTMAWFDDLWLKEGFATYMAAKMQEALDPGSDAWKTFHLRNKPPAYAVDATAGTTPIWQELANLDQAKSTYGPIVYNKAPSVLKQLEFLVGADAFRAGVQQFLRQHQFENATWQDLLASIALAARQPLEEWGQRYILQRGMPVIEQRLDVRAGRVRQLELLQRPATELVADARWPIRTQVVLWYAEAPNVIVPVTITGSRTVVEDAAGRPVPDFVYANYDDQAYALILPDSHSVAALERAIGTVDDALLRAMLWGSMWDLVREARFGPVRYLEMVLRELPVERDEQILSVLLARTARATRAFLSAEQRQTILPRVEEVLLAAVNDTTLPYGIRKPHLDALIAIAETPAVLAILDATLDSTHAVGEQLRGPTRWAIVTTLLARGAGSAHERYAAEVARDTTPDGRRRAFVAAAARPDSATKREYFDRYLNDESLNEDWATSSLEAFHAAGHGTLTLPFLRPALDTLPWIQRNRRIFFLGSWLSAFIASRDDEPALAIVRQYLAEVDLADDLRLKVLQSADELERTVRIRSRFAVSGVAAERRAASSRD